MLFQKSHWPPSVGIRRCHVTSKLRVAILNLLVTVDADCYSHWVLTHACPYCILSFADGYQKHTTEIGILKSHIKHHLSHPQEELMVAGKTRLNAPLWPEYPFRHWWIPTCKCPTVGDSNHKSTLPSTVIDLSNLCVSLSGRNLILDS